MKNVIKSILKYAEIAWDIVLNVFLFLLYICVFGIYKLLFFIHKEDRKLAWSKVDTYNIVNKNLPF